MSGCWEYIIYVTAGRKQIPTWEELSTSHARKLHEMVIGEL